MGKRNKIASRKRRRSKRRAIVVLCICLSGALYLGAQAALELMDRKQGADFYSKLATVNMSNERLPVQTSVPQTEPQGQPFVEVGETVAAKQQEPMDDGQSHIVFLQTESSPQPVVQAPEPDIVLPQSEMDFDALWEHYPDIVGWIQCEGTLIDYPIVQGTNNDYYLDHLPDGTKNKAGSIMMDFSCDPSFSNDVTILHGHHMRNGEMFGQLYMFGEEEYYAEHPTMRLYTPKGDFDVEIFATCTVNGGTFGYRTVYENQATFDAFVSKMIAASDFEIAADIKYTDRLLLLSTCAYDYKNARFIVVGKIMHPEE